ncbi:MAG TPA: 50S ribosomal protein L11 methyltransferase, partial [Paludibacteraceae bacterium]|nr:50S ribosomal protein L11 methyltransferase [Paludibacteraceae bacterium]
MDYQKVTFRLVDAEDFMADILVALLGNNGFESFEETTQGIIAYCPAPSFDETAMIENITSALPELKYAYRIETIADQNWNKTWEEHHFEPIEINNRCIIHSSRKPILKTVPYDIVINPQQAFGTGTHETTRMMLTYLLDNEIDNKSVLDMGCGTGVLAIMASLRGAKHIEAIDIDSWAQKNAEENIRLNARTNIHVHLGDATLLKNKLFDIILANINRNILLKDMSVYT